MYYTLEYSPGPVKYITRLIKILKPGGKLIGVTPNLDDILKNDWGVPVFEDFF